MKVMCGMKTIFITAQIGAEIKNWFLGGFYRFAKESPDIRLIVFANPEVIEKYASEFQHERCVFEVLPDLRLSKRPIRQFFRIMAYASVPTDAAWFRMKYIYLNGGSKISFAAKRCMQLLGHTGQWRALLRFVEYYGFRDDRAWDDYFMKYNPDVVFATTTYRDVDTTMIKAASRRKIPTVGMLRGWDNMSSKAFLFVHPDHLMVQNPTMRTEAIEWNDVPLKKIHVIGFPYLDSYVDPSWNMTREEVARVIGADPKKKWIGYFVGGLFVGFLRAGDGALHGTLLSEAVGRGEFGNAQILASIHPGDRGDRVTWDRGPGLGEHIQPIRFAKSWNFSADKMRVVMNFIRECAVTVDFGSSLSLEAALFDKPIVFLGFNSHVDKNVPWHKRISSAYDYYTHVQYLIKAGGVWEVANEKEMVHAIKTYLADPAKHREGRKRIVEELVGPFDGGAGRRAFDIITSAV